MVYSEPYYEDPIPVTFGLDPTGAPEQRTDTVGYVVAVRAGRVSLLNAINAAISTLADTGDLERITEQRQWR